jgi:hypothetical protein
VLIVLSQAGTATRPSTVLLFLQGLALLLRPQLLHLLLLLLQRWLLC